MEHDDLAIFAPKSEKSKKAKRRKKHTRSTEEIHREIQMFRLGEGSPKATLKYIMEQLQTVRFFDGPHGNRPIGHYTPPIASAQIAKVNLYEGRPYIGSKIQTERGVQIRFSETESDLYNGFAKDFHITNQMNSVNELLKTINTDKWWENYNPFRKSKDVSNNSLRCGYLVAVVFPKEIAGFKISPRRCPTADERIFPMALVPVKVCPGKFEWSVRCVIPESDHFLFDWSTCNTVGIPIQKLLHDYIESRALEAGNKEICVDAEVEKTLDLIGIDPIAPIASISLICNTIYQSVDNNDLRGEMTTISAAIPESRVIGKRWRVPSPK